MTESVRTLVVVVTGVSGAGKSTAVHALEDLGFFCVDNLPTPVMKSTLDAFATVGVRRIAIGIDVRVRGFLDAAASALESLQVPGERELEVLFLDASDEALLRRFSSTRRPHPLSTTLEPGGERAATAVLDGIRIERELLMPLRSRATLVLDTTRLSVHELRREVTAHFGPGAARMPHMRTRFVSFGFKFGTPVDADLLFDVRFLDNPYFVPELRDLSGSMQAVKDFVLSQADCKGFMERVASLLEFCLPRFEREGKSYLTVAIGCTGGRHRSVVIADQLAAQLRQSDGVSIDVVHRDIDRVRMTGPEADPDHSSAPATAQSSRRRRRRRRPKPPNRKLEQVCAMDSNSPSSSRGTFEVRNKLGLHARAATKLVQLASKYPCDILVSRAGQAANAKSVMGVLLLCGSKGTKLDIEATGEDAAEAVRKLGELINNRFGEDE